MSTPAVEIPPIPVTPLSDRVIVFPDVPRTETASGLQLVSDWNPDTTGVVTAVGPGARCETCGTRSEPAVVVGDHVVFSYTGGAKVTLEGAEFLVLRASDILGILED